MYENGPWLYEGSKLDGRNIDYKEDRCPVSFDGTN